MILGLKKRIEQVESSTGELIQHHEQLKVESDQKDATIAIQQQQLSVSEEAIAELRQKLDLLVLRRESKDSKSEIQNKNIENTIARDGDAGAGQIDELWDEAMVQHDQFLAKVRKMNF